jgi:hypothetical protein
MFLCVYPGGGCNFFFGAEPPEKGAFNRIKNVQGLIAMNPGKPFTYRINHQIHHPPDTAYPISDNWCFHTFL